MKQSGPAKAPASTTPVKESAPVMPPSDGTADADLLAFEGGALLLWLQRAAEKRGHDRATLARCLGVTYGYIAQLRSGARQVNRISDDFADACAHYLEVPRIAVLKAAARITLQDFVDPTNGESEVDQAISFIVLDKEWGSSLPVDVVNGPMSLKLFVVSLYEKATGRRLIASPHQEPQIPA